MKIMMLIFVLLISGCGVEKYYSEKIKTEEKSSVTSLKTEQTYAIGEAYTTISDKGKNRMANILLACSKISGKELSPNEEFSFNDLTGMKTEKAGYKNAPIIVDGEKSYGIGGGVCQVSTTIYIAALNAGLEITEHHNHSEMVAYAEKGMDATVVYGVKDFKFRNNTKTPITVLVWVQEDTVIAKLMMRESQ